jgi:hypothetical protein
VRREVMVLRTREAQSIHQERLRTGRLETRDERRRTRTTGSGGGH